MEKRKEETKEINDGRNHLINFIRKSQFEWRVRLKIVPVGNRC